MGSGDLFSLATPILARNFKISEGTNNVASPIFSPSSIDSGSGFPSVSKKREKFKNSNYGGLVLKNFNLAILMMIFPPEVPKIQRVVGHKDRLIEYMELVLYPID